MVNIIGREYSLLANLFHVEHALLKPKPATRDEYFPSESPLCAHTLSTLCCFNGACKIESHCFSETQTPIAMHKFEKLNFAEAASQSGLLFSCLFM